MAKLKKLTILFTAMLLALAAVICALFCKAPSSYAYNGGDYNYRFEFTRYEATYDVHRDRSMNVTINFTVEYQGYYSTDILYDIPITNGDRVRGLKAAEFVNGVEVPLVYYVRHDDRNFVTLDIGDDTNKYSQTHSYRVTYRYELTKATAGEGKNDLNFYPFPFGSSGEINNARITVNLPDGMTSYECFEVDGFGNIIGGYDSALKGKSINIGGNFNSAAGVLLKLKFKDGVLSYHRDMTPYYILIAACALFAIMFALKLLVFNKNGLTPVVNHTAPEGMDPLMMGKLIDGKVDNSDVTSLLFYWADKGFIKIDMQDKDNPTLIRIYNKLPADIPHYQSILYDRMFGKEDMIKINSLTGQLGGTIQKIKQEVNAQAVKPYSPLSTGISVAFAIICALLAGIAPAIVALSTISVKLKILGPVLIVAPMIAVYALTRVVLHYSHKLGKVKLALLYAGIAALAAAFVAMYAWLVPSYIIEILAKALLASVGFASVMLAATFVNYSEEYKNKLNHIVGFKQFILTAEKEKLETMLEENPEFYFSVLPYAQVLGVSDIWEKKFKSITLVPPRWCMAGYANVMFTAYLFNTTVRTINHLVLLSIIASGMDGGHGGFGGGFGGGFSGGGHGGGGFHGR